MTCWTNLIQIKSEAIELTVDQEQLLRRMQMALVQVSEFSLPNYPLEFIDSLEKAIESASTSLTFLQEYSTKLRLFEEELHQGFSEK